GLSARLAVHPPEQPPYLATIDSESPLLAAVLTPPFFLTLAGQASTIALDMLIHNLHENGWSPPGVVGEVTLSEAFARRWSEATGEPFGVFMSQRIYQLRAVQLPVGIPGALRIATLGDAPLVADWLHAFSAEALSPITLKGARAMAQQRIANGEIFLWDDGAPVSMAGSARPSRRGICINAVYTPPAQRKRGYARACVAALSQLLLGRGYEFCMLYTDLNNPTSNAIYQAIGYEPVTDSAMYRFGTELHGRA
ncbi:hypothetical protein SE17_29835, partial [Kouleothrix aurantiaca]